MVENKIEELDHTSFNPENFEPYLKAMIRYLDYFKNIIILEGCTKNLNTIRECNNLCESICMVQDKILDVLKSIDPENYVCPYCDPEKFVVYGKCKKCDKEERPPLMDMPIPLGFCTEKGSALMNKLFSKFEEK